MSSEGTLDGVAPRLAGHDVAHHCAVDAVLSSELALEDSTGCIAGSDVSDLRGGELGLPVSLATGEQSFIRPIREIFAPGAVEQVVGANTERVVTAVATVVVGREWPLDQFVGETVGHFGFCMRQAEQSVSVPRFLSGPEPTRTEMRHMRRDGAVLVYLRPETNVGRDEAALVRSHRAIVPLWFTSAPCGGAV